MSAVLEMLERTVLAATASLPGDWLLLIPLLGILGRLQDCAAMATRPSGRWSWKVCMLMFVLLAGLSLLAAAGVAVALYAWVSPAAGLPQALAKIEETCFSSLARLNLASNPLVRQTGDVIMIGIVSVWGTCAVWITQKGLVRLRHFWREIPHRGGAFLGAPVIRLLEDGRKILLLSDYVFRDPRGKMWTAPSGTISDGASIPRFFWQSFGPPLCGHYRNASIIHDYYCAMGLGRLGDVPPSRPVPRASAVHRMFYEACLAEGLSARKARLAYWAVRRFGPYWGDEVNDPRPRRSRFRHGRSGVPPMPGLRGRSPGRIAARPPAS